MTILSVGFACYDQFFFTPSYPKENTKAVSVDFIESGGGPCGNAAYLLGLWGEKVVYLGHLNQDIYAQKIVSEFNQVGVNTEHIIFSAEMQTPLAAIIVNNQTGARTIVTRKLNTPPRLTIFEKEKLQAWMNNISNHAEIAILIDGHEPELSEYVIHHFPDAKVVMDAGSLRESNLYLAKYTDYLVASENFALAYSGLDKLTSKQDLMQILQKMAQIAKGQVFITLGEKGCAYLADNKINIIPSYLCKAVDTTGAGDIFHGAFIYGVSYGWEIETIIEFASLTASLSIEQRGVRNAMPDLCAVNKAKLHFEKNLQAYFK
ncbi:PfkB family carbohydrate kinase [Utexia brackfieldae]|uniref:carbohydrate kinase family protein n=1 Tax=Utexia brackfieldae TaxID=3074108 RepID=UPI00370D066E